ncbi:hypothetical protein F5146DRAFT_1202576 [Armillaria mellea]|nr:hypothetical protein F5146DRAFT_1202576 [Armillaria mellea]
MSSTETFLDDLLDRYIYIPSIARSPELSTLIDTNNAPLPFQTAQLKSLVADLKTLQEHASHLGGVTRDYETALSPIRHLLAEILVEIFRWTCVDCNAYNPYQLSGFSVFEINQGPWLLSHSFPQSEETVDKLEEVYLCCWKEDPPLQNIDGFEIAADGLEPSISRNMHPDAVIPFPTDNLVSFLDHRELPERKRLSEYLGIVLIRHLKLAWTKEVSPVESKSLQTLSAFLGTFLSGLNLTELEEHDSDNWSRWRDDFLPMPLPIA